MSNKSFKTAFCFLSAIALISFLTFVSSVSAVETENGSAANSETPASTTVIENEVSADENISAQELNVGEPKILPTSRFYFLTKWRRAIRGLFAFGPLRRAKLREKFASEKLLEAKKLAEKTQNSEILKKAIENYKQEMDKIKKNIEKIKAKAENNPKVERFLDKFIQHQALHQRILEKLENNPNIASSTISRIKEARKRHLQRFKEVMLKLSGKKEKIRERLEKNLNAIKGSRFKDFKAIELLERMEENSPEDIKEEIKAARERISEKLKKKLENMPEEQRKRFEEYVEKISGKTEKKKAIIRRLALKMKGRPAAQALRKAEQRLENKNLKLNQQKGAKRIRLSEARRIALKSKCAEIGKVGEIVLYNAATNTWWMKLRVFDHIWKAKKLDKKMCHPICVVNALTKEVSINWRCTGLLPSAND